MAENQQQRIAIFPGSFDPITNGHLNLITRAASVADHLIVAVLQNAAKQPLLAAEERLALIADATSGIRNVEVAAFRGLISEFAASRGARVLIRGLRTMSDFEIETQMASINGQLNPGLETLFLAARPEWVHISSRFVKEIHGLGGDISAFVPPGVVRHLRTR